jgi:sec-independent protein translocase protein TatB
MFEVGFDELILLFVIGLLVLGPERLPKVANVLGKWVGRARRTASHLRHQLEREVALAELEERRKTHAEPVKPSAPVGAATAATGAPRAPVAPAPVSNESSPTGGAETQDSSPPG